MDIIVSLLGMLNTLSPLAVIALLGIVIFMLVQSKAEVVLSKAEVGGKVDLVANNHLHDVGEKLGLILETLQRMEVSNSENFAYLKARVNGGKNG